MSKERWIWIGGWGLPPEWLEQKLRSALPAAEHVVVAPGPDTIAAIDWSEFDRAGGYSLGAFLLLKQAGMVTIPAVLIAPFFAFAAEFALGGKTERTRIRYLARWLKRDPQAALADFYNRAELDVPPASTLPYEMEDLQWGLDQLAHEQAPARLPETWSGIVGDRDPLLDASQLLATEPRLRVVPGAGHEPDPLLSAIPSLPLFR